MSNYALKSKNEKEEFFDDSDILDKKAEQLAQLILSSKHFIAFTGAGLSTSAGVPDFRSGIDTKVPTGAGTWEEEATGKTGNVQFRTDYISAKPTPSHMALVELERRGYLKFIISQNCDGLHLKSGFPSTKIAELHGNTQLEKCRNSECNRVYLRDFDVMNEDEEVEDHSTGRNCENCGQMLYDTIIDFGESLPEKELNDAILNSKMSDLCLILGSSMRVTPASEMPETVSEAGGKIAIVNLQKTPVDHLCEIRANSFVDDFMIRVMAKLNIPIPEFKLKRRIKIMKTNKPYLQIMGVDDKGLIFTFLKKIEVKLDRGKETLRQKEIFDGFPDTKLDDGIAKVKLDFYSWYGEPSYKFDLGLSSLVYDKPKYFILEYDPKTLKWISFQETVINSN